MFVKTFMFKEEEENTESGKRGFFFFNNEECGSKLKLKDLGKSPL